MVSSVEPCGSYHQASVEPVGRRGIARRERLVGGLVLGLPLVLGLVAHVLGARRADLVLVLVGTGLLLAVVGRRLAGLLVVFGVMRVIHLLEPPFGVTG